jgi:DNA-binding transcriptional regulator YhcF (GntR family)
VALKLDPHVPGALHERIAGAVRHAIAQGELAPGARLPTARELAAQLDVNANTVLRAYRQLASESLVDLRRGRGVTVRGQPALARLYELTDELIAEARKLGVTRGKLIALIAQRS